MACLPDASGLPGYAPPAAFASYDNPDFLDEPGLQPNGSDFPSFRKGRPIAGSFRIAVPLDCWKHASSGADLC
jgi:hypothetical protein